MNNNYTSENGGRKEVSGTTESRWHISTDVRNTLALFVGAVTLLAGVWGVCESSISRLADRFDQQDARFDQIDARFDQQDRELARIGGHLDRLESTTAEGFRQANDRMDRTDRRIDRLEVKVDKIETLLIDYLLRSDVPVDEPAPDPAAQPAGPGEGASQHLPAKPVAPRTGTADGIDRPTHRSRPLGSRGTATHSGRVISFDERGVPRGL